MQLQHKFCIIQKEHRISHVTNSKIYITIIGDWHLKRILKSKYLFIVKFKPKLKNLIQNCASQLVILLYWLFIKLVLSFSSFLASMQKICCTQIHTYVTHLSIPLFLSMHVFVNCYQKLGRFVALMSNVIRLGIRPFITPRISLVFACLHWRSR